MSIDAAPADSYWDALTRADRDAAAGLVAHLRARGASLDEVLADVVMPAQDRIGRLWASNAWTVAQEHAATALSEEIVRELAVGTPEPLPGSPVVVVACTENEWHALPALVVAVMLREGGCDVELLGSNTSPADLVGVVHTRRPVAVLLSTSLSSSLPRVVAHLEVVQQLGVPAIVGGRAYDADGRRARALGAWGYAATPGAALDLLADLPATFTAPPAPAHGGVEEARRIHAQRDSIGQDATRTADLALGLIGGGESAMSPNDWRVVLATHLPHLVGCVAGAVLTEDPSVLSDARAWLAGVLVGRGAPAEVDEVLGQALAGRLAGYPRARALLADRPG